jgi:nifR3 family TIM-barrel protein
MLALGDITLEIPFFQAPLSGYSDYAMRRIALDFKAPLTFAGVMLAKSAANPRVLKLPAFKPRDNEHPVGAQILGSDPQVMAQAAEELVNVGYDLIDLNFACPAPKVLRRQRGGFLLNQPDRAIEIYRRVRDAVSCPVLIKLRIGFRNNTESRDNFWKIVTDATDNGVDAMVIHGRSVLQKFSGRADWEILAEVKRRFPKATIIGSGDLFCPQTAAELMQEAEIDGLCIARGAIGNPWIFSHLRAILKGKTLPELPNLDQQARTILKHFELVSGLYPHKKAVRYFRKFIVGYCKLHPQRKKVQKALLAAVDKTQLLAAIKQWYLVNCYDF